MARPKKDTFDLEIETIFRLFDIKNNDDKSRILFRLVNKLLAEKPKEEKKSSKTTPKKTVKENKNGNPRKKRRKKSEMAAARLKT